MSRACWARHGRSASWRSASRTSTAVMPTSSRRSRSGSVLAHVRVAVFRPRQDALAATGALAAEWLDHTLRDGQILALSSGSSVEAVVSAAAADGLRNVEVVPLVGGLATDGSVVASQELVRELAARLGATYRCLHGPALLHSDSAHDALLAEPSIGRILARARSADIALVGIGAIGSDSTAEVLEGLGLTDGPAERIVVAEAGRDHLLPLLRRRRSADPGHRARPGARGRSGRPPAPPDGDRSGHGSGQGGCRARGTARRSRRRIDHRRRPRPFGSQRRGRVVARTWSVTAPLGKVCVLALLVTSVHFLR